MMFLLQILSLLFVFTTITAQIPIGGRDVRSPVSSSPKVPDTHLKTLDEEEEDDYDDDEEDYSERPTDNPYPDYTDETATTTTTTTTAAPAPVPETYDIYDHHNYLDGEIYKGCEDKSYNFLVVVFNEQGSCDGFLIATNWVLSSYECLDNTLGTATKKTVRSKFKSNFPFRNVSVTKPSKKGGFAAFKITPGYKESWKIAHVPLPSPDKKITCAKFKYVYGVVRRVETKIRSYWLCSDIKLEKKCDQKDLLCGKYSSPYTEDEFFMDLCQPKHHSGGGLVCDDVLYGFLQWQGCENGRAQFSDLRQWVKWIRSNVRVRSGERIRIASSKSTWVEAGCLLVLLATGMSVLRLFDR